MDRPDHTEPSPPAGPDSPAPPPYGYPPVETPTYPPPGYPSAPPPSGPPSAPPPPGFPLPPARTRSHPFLDIPGAPPADRGAAGVWILFGLIGFVAGQVVALILTDIAAHLAGQGGQLSKIADMAEPPEWYVGVSLAGLWAGFLLGPWLASKARGTGRFLADLGVRFRPIDLLGLVIGPAGQVVVAIIYAPFINHLKNFTAPTQKLTGGSHGGGFVVIAIMTVVLAPFFEELFFRGLLFKALARLFTPAAIGPSTRRTIGVAVAVVADGLLFGAAHAELAQLAGLAVFGMILAVISYRTGRLGMNMIAHASFNLVAVLVVVGNRGTIWH